MYIYDTHINVSIDKTFSKIHFEYIYTMIDVFRLKSFRT